MPLLAGLLVITTNVWTGTDRVLVSFRFDRGTDTDMYHSDHWHCYPCYS